MLRVVVAAAAVAVAAVTPAVLAVAGRLAR
jgi:hypothetical protein